MRPRSHAFSHACFLTVPAFAQTVADLAPSVPEGSQMLLEADTLVYDNDASTVTAVGGVQIDYAGNRLVAQRVTYDRKTSRLIASGNVEIVNSDGTKIFSQEIDITDDFADGFVNALRVETADKTYFAAESAKREGGILTTFNNGVYTACEPCEAKPDKAPIWRIKAQKIIWNGQKKTVRFENSNFEFFGFPIAYPAGLRDRRPDRQAQERLPDAQHRLQERARRRRRYPLLFRAFADLRPHGQGHRLHPPGLPRRGRMAPAFQQRPVQPEDRRHQPGRTPMPSTPARSIAARMATNRLRGMVGTKGQLRPSIRAGPSAGTSWPSRTRISRAPTISRATPTASITSEVYLTGLNDRNYFDLRAMHFEVQEDALDSEPGATRRQAALGVPVARLRLYSRYAAGRRTAFAQRQCPRAPARRNWTRPALDAVERAPTIHGLAGSSGRLTTEAEWKRTVITDGGLLVTPLLAFRGDGSYLSTNNASLDAIDNMAGQLGVADDVRSSLFRYMATLGLELRWPVLFSSTSATHVLEPMAQVFARPSEQNIGGLGIPNEDAQSFVFDAATLFERDKFSGYDRMEGGTRANLGLRYSGSFANGWTTNALAGQSYQLAGDNSFAAPDLVNAGATSGLETETSDYVAPRRHRQPERLLRFGERPLRRTDIGRPPRRGEGRTGCPPRRGLGPLCLHREASRSTASPTTATKSRSAPPRASTTNWRVFGSGTYDIHNDTLVKNGVGFAYDDECFTYMMTYSESRGIGDNERSFAARWASTSRSARSAISVPRLINSDTA